MYNRHLDTFLAVAQTGSFRKAAEVLYISSSAVIQQIDLLERDLQVTLFNRSRRGIQLTDAGEYLVSEARDYIHRGEQIRSFMIDLSKRNHSITVGTSMADKCRLLYDLWIMFTQKNGNYEIRLTPLDAGQGISKNVQLVESIRDGAPWQKGWSFLEICSVPCGCALAKDHPCSGKSFISFEDMRSSDVVLIDRSNGSRSEDFYRQLRENGISFTAFDDWSPSLTWECSLQKKMLLVPTCWEDVLFDLTVIPCAVRGSAPYGLFYREEASGPLQEFLQFVKDVYTGTNPYDLIPIL
ncbi:MAG: LysR family transcriptional regulator [Oscillospiraceae bacterium]|nr:LysR family transcriptional regulator [Oscillospiraceae bacterium]